LTKHKYNDTIPAMSKDFENNSSDKSYLVRLGLKVGAAASAAALVAACGAPSVHTSAQPECKRGAETGFYSFGQAQGIDAVTSYEKVYRGDACYDAATADVQDQINKSEKHSGTSDAFPAQNEVVTTYRWLTVGVSPAPAQ
jgi:hypothetical protein